MDQRLAEIGMAANGASQAPPNSPGLEVVLAFVKLGEALKSTGKTAESRGYLQSGRATLVKLNVPTDITQEIKEQILAEGDELLEPDDDEPDSSNPPNSATNLP